MSAMTESQSWKAYRSGETAPWDIRRVVHLHRRAGFAATWSELERDLADGPEAAVDRLLRGNAYRIKVRRPSKADDSDSSPNGAGSASEGQHTEGRKNFERMAQVIGDAAVASGNPDRLKAWWVYRMIFSPDPLGERLALMWHNHFATSNRKVDNLALMREQNEIFRTRRSDRLLAAGSAEAGHYERKVRAEAGRYQPFGKLLRRVVKHPAMLIWLDADANRREHPNENLARELMELFTLGVGNYTETDVKEAARALAGWTVVNGKFRIVPEYHDDGEKTILGRTGRFDGDDLLEILLKQPATARRLAWRLCQEFFGEGVVTDEHLDSLAAGLREHDLDVGWAVETILRSELFFSDVRQPSEAVGPALEGRPTRKNIGNRVKSPAEFVVGAVRALEMFDPPPSTPTLAEWLARMGQDLFNPPTVFGWDGGRAWITTRSMIARTNFAAALAEGSLRNPARPPDILALAKRHRGAGRIEGQATRTLRASRSLSEVTAFLARLLYGIEDATELANGVTAALKEETQATPQAARRIVAVLLGSPSGQLG